MAFRSQVRVGEKGIRHSGVWTEGLQENLFPKQGKTGLGRYVVCTLATTITVYGNVFTEVSFVCSRPEHVALARMTLLKKM